MALAVVDIQGFNLIDEEKCWRFYPKEITIYDGVRTNYYLLEPPIAYQKLSSLNKRQVRFDEKLHGLRYSNGDVAYNKISRILSSILQSSQQIYVKGYQKYQYLLNLNLKNVEIINLETWKELNLPKLSKSSPSCFNHLKYVGRCYCSNTNCLSIYNWLKINVLNK